MTETVARIKKGSLHFEVLVDLDEALKFKKGESDYLVPLTDKIFENIKRGDVAAKNDLEIAFGTTDSNVIAKEIVKKGELENDQAHREGESDRKIKQVVDFLSKNAVDPRTGNPLTPERIKTAIEESRLVIKNTPIESQTKEIIDKISLVIPIKIETRKIKITVPAVQTGKVYGLLSQYREKENWLNDGSLEVIVKIPAGITLEFYDKLNSMTHGSALTEDITE
jgi:ribosome maturation protein SDO1